MMRSVTLTNIVLALVLFVGRSTQILETGYTYDGNVSVEEHIVHEDLKCTFLFAGLTHIEVTKQLSQYGIVNSYYNSKKVGQIVHYVRNSKYVIELLYRLKIMPGALWILHLYVSIVHGFYNKSSDQETDFRKIMATHDYVAHQLRKDLKNCRNKNNSFNSYGALIFSKRRPYPKDFKDLLTRNIRDAHVLLMKNHIHICNQPLDEKFGETLQAKNIFLNNLGKVDLLKEDLMNVFNVQVEWSNTDERLTKSWCDAHIVNWHTNNFKYIKLYYELNFNFLKIIMFRLTLKHVYFIVTIVNRGHRMNYWNAWYHIVKLFSDMLSLSEDFHVKHLLVILDNFVNKKNKKVRCLERFLLAILNTLCKPLGCVATNNFNLNGREFQTPFKSLTKDEILDLKITEKSSRVDYYSLENARVFLEYLKWMFSKVDFIQIRLLIKHINGLKP